MPPQGWNVPGIGVVGPHEPFSQVVGLTREPPPVANPNPSTSPPWPTWFNETQHSFAQIRAQPTVSQQRPTRVTAQASAVPAIFTGPVGPLLPVQAHLPVSGAPSGEVYQASTSASNTVSIFSQVHALRASASSSHGTSQTSSQPAASSPVPATTAGSYHGRALTCTVCLEDFGPGDHLCRLSCGHSFHCVCVGELALHSPGMSDVPQLTVECPNCRTQATCMSSWYYPRLPVSASPEEGPASGRVETPAPANTPNTRESTSEFLSPEAESSYPWWPVPAVVPDSSSSNRAQGASQAYHTSVCLANGRTGLLIDPGSYGNLVGEEWLVNASVRMQREPGYAERQQPLSVGGVGRGSQVCSRDCQLPIAITRTDGSVALGTYNAPVVSSSGCPALLGLRSLQENRALLDLERNQLHFLGQGEMTLILPPGSESYQLETARSGHLLLPCDAFSAAASGALQGEHHLFADNPSAPQADSSGMAAVQNDALPMPLDHLMATAQEQADEEEACSQLLADFDWTRAVALLLRLTSTPQDSVTSGERFGHGHGVSLNIGSYVHGGTVGLTLLAQQRPQLTRLLCHMVRVAAPNAAFTTVQLIRDIASPIHTDKFNVGQNYLVPLRLPRSGGHLWQEIQEGDKVPGPVEIREHDGQMRAGAIVRLREGQALSIDPKRRHATQPWSQGTRLILAVYTSGSQHKLTSAQLEQLSDLGFRAAAPHMQATTQALAVEPMQQSNPLPKAQVPQVSGRSQVPTRADRSQASPQQPQVSVQAQHSNPVPKAQAPQVSGRSQVPKAKAQSTGRFARVGVSVVKRVLLISLYHSTMTAFLEQGWEPMRLRPLELLRDSFDDALYRLKEAEYKAVWVDLAEPRQFAGQDRMSQVCSRLAVLMQCAERCDVPIIFSSCRRIAWQHVAIQTILQSRNLHVSYQNWCAHGVKVAPGIEASAVKHKMLSTIPLPSAECACPRGLEHTHDLDINRGPGSARERASAEHQVLSHVIATLSQLVEVELSGSVKSPDSFCQSAESSGSLLTYACECCGLRQATKFCPCCSEPCVALPSQEPLVSAREAWPSQQPLPVTEPGNHSPSRTPYSSEAFPTEQKLRLQERRKQGLATIVRKKVKKVQQHFDDCGDSLASLEVNAQAPRHQSYLSACFSDEDENDALTDCILSLVAPQANAIEAQPVGQERLSYVNAAEAVDLDEMLSLLSEESHVSWGPEIVELCGGLAGSSKACVRRRLRAGNNFDIVCGVDLLHQPSQEKVIQYLSEAKPLVVVMAPVCLPYGPLGTQNRTMYPEAWQRANARFAPLAQFCGQVAELQMQQQRYFLCEQPFPSTLYEIAPWPSVRASPECCRVVLHQCQLGLVIAGQPAKNRLSSPRMQCSC